MVCITPTTATVALMLSHSWSSAYPAPPQANMHAAVTVATAFSGVLLAAAADDNRSSGSASVLFHCSPCCPNSSTSIISPPLAWCLLIVDSPPLFCQLLLLIYCHPYSNAILAHLLQPSLFIGLHHCHFAIVALLEQSLLAFL